jgi:hypothetical protein
MREGFQGLDWRYSSHAPSGEPPAITSITQMSLGVQRGILWQRQAISLAPWREQRVKVAHVVAPMSHTGHEH